MKRTKVLHSCQGRFAALGVFLQEKLNKVQYAEEQARVEKERSELDVMKLERELEKLQYQVRY